MSTKAELKNRIDELERLNRLQGRAITNARVERDEAKKARQLAIEEVAKLRLLIRSLLPLTGIAEWAEKDTQEKTNPWQFDQDEGDPYDDD